MAKIKPNLTITANSSSSTTPGPLSMALSLAAIAGNTTNGGNLLVDDVNSKMFTIPTDATASVELLNGAALGGTTLTGGTHGCFLYLRNTATADTSDIYVAFTDSATPNLATAGAASDRTFTLKAGEFAFLPWDYTQDVNVQASGAGQVIECWVFDRSAS
jgi:hypothetical protein